MNALEALKAAGTSIVTDTADFTRKFPTIMRKHDRLHHLEISTYSPSEGTTNPSLLLAAAQLPAHQSLVADAQSYFRSLPVTIPPRQRLIQASEYLAVLFGKNIHTLTSAPAPRISTQVSPLFAFQTEETVAASLRILALYQDAGIPRSDVRIKIPATWEGLQAARILVAEHNVKVLITVVFGLVQVVAAAEAHVACVAPYVGRMADWHRSQAADAAPLTSLSSTPDPGVAAVRRMCWYLRQSGHASRTKVMAASFRNTAQLRQLSGCDILTVGPALLAKLQMEDAQEEEAWIEKIRKSSPFTCLASTPT